MAPPARILLADDDPDSRDMYSEFLSDASCKVVTAADGEETVMYATRYPLDLVVLDPALPKLDGFRVMRELRGPSRNESHSDRYRVRSGSTHASRSEGSGSDVTLGH